jgi:hypothetical protein
MKEVIPPIDKGLILKELTRDKFLRKTNKGSNELYIITHHDSPQTMLELGRLREVTFRIAGGGTGKEADIDEYDTGPNPYQQLLVWDPHKKEILGGYRFMLGGNLQDPESELATSRLFHFTDKFKKDFLPFMIELGRSFVQPAYQSTNRNKKSLYALDNLWDGLGALCVIYPFYKYFFGKVTMYTSFNREARNLILYFLEKHFNGNPELIYPYKPLKVDMNRELMESILAADNVQENLKILSHAVRARGELIPPLINAYINLSPTLKCFGTVMNDHFGDVEETAILITISDMYPSKTDRHIKSYKNLVSLIKRSL